MKFIIDTLELGSQTWPMRCLLRFCSLLLAAPVLVGCQENLIDTNEDGTGGSSSQSNGGNGTGAQEPDKVPSPDPKISHEKDGSGYKSKIDASDREAWVFLDLDERVYPAADANEQGDWDLAIRRVKLRLNGGISGTSDVAGKFVDGKDAFDNMNKSPEGPFETDKKGNGDPSSDPFGEDGLVFGFWYDYQSEGHVVTPKPRAYVIQSNKGEIFKLQILDYYNAARTSGHYTIRWAKLPAQNKFYQYAAQYYSSTPNQARLLAVIPAEDFAR